MPGHTQRGGSPCAYDRVFATRVGAAAAELILNQEYGYMIAMKNQKITKVPLQDVAGKLKMVDPQDGIIKEARTIGISFGDQIKDLENQRCNTCRIRHFTESSVPLNLKMSRSGTYYYYIKKFRLKQTGSDMPICSAEQEGPVRQRLRRFLQRQSTVSIR